MTTDSLKCRPASFEDAIITACIRMTEKHRNMESGTMVIPLGTFSYKIRKVKTKGE